MKMIHTIKRLISTSEQRNSYIFQVVSICIIGLLTVVSSFALGSITQNIIDTTFEKMMLSFVIFILTSAAVTLLDWKRSKHLVKMIENIKMNYREKTAKTVLTGEFSRVQPIPLGDIVSRVNTDVNLAANGCELIITGLRNILIPIVLSVILLMINWRMAIGYIFPVALIFLYQRITKNAQDGIMPWRVAYGEMTAETKDLISNRIMIKSYKLQEKSDEWAVKAIANYKNKGIKGLGKSYVETVPGLLVNSLPLFGCVLAGIYQVSNNILSVQGFISVFLLAQNATNELFNLPNIIVNMPSSLASAKRLFEIWDIPECISGNEESAKSDVAIEADNINFKYPSSDDAIISNLSLVVHKGENIALVGPSGCGKSTLMKLIAGLYRADSGEIKIWGNEISEWNSEFLRKNMGMMEQSTFLFDASIYDNIVCAKPDATFDEVKLAAERSNLLEWIEEQQDNWEVRVGENGHLLSGGLRQRAGLARIFLQDAPLILLDEATSALDTKNEAEILNSLKLFNADKTQIMVAHRFSSILEADRIIVMNYGSIAEEGTHEELLSKKGLYTKLYEKWEAEPDE